MAGADVSLELPTVRGWAATLAPQKCGQQQGTHLVDKLGRREGDQAALHRELPFFVLQALDVDAA